MHAALFAVVATLGAELLPVPTGGELAKAEKTVQDVFGDKLKAAKTAKQKTELAQKMLETAAGSQPAEKYALLQKAKELAIIAGDSAVGIQAVQDLVDTFAPEKPQEATSWGTQGHRLWNQADRKRPPEKLRMQLAAAECYLRCLDGLEGFQRAAVEKRLRGLGWAALWALAFEFEDGTEGWRAVADIEGLETKGGCLVGRITGGDPHINRFGLSLEAKRCQTIEIRMMVSAAGTRSELFWITSVDQTWGSDKVLYFRPIADGQFHVYRLDLSSHRAWSGTVAAIRIDPGEWSHDTTQNERFAIDYVRGR